MLSKTRCKQILNRNGVTSDVEIIKLRGEVIETEENIFGISNDKYVDVVIIYYDDVFWFIYSIFDNYLNKCHYQDVEVYDFEKLAVKRYDELKGFLQEF